ncbi:MAG: serpin family protein [Candidatus Marithrix sp.]|nr:serpin family protein [Candidatus Marithrix sp.]
MTIRLYTFQIIWLLLTVFETTVLAENTSPTNCIAECNQIEMVVNNNNKFALELYEQLKTDDNLFFSPYSISTVMAMVYSGAKGNTASQMAQVLHFPNQQIHKDFYLLQQQINNPQANLKLQIDNLFCGQQGYYFLTDFKTNLKKFYQIELQEIDFATDYKKIHHEINTWVESKTKIKNLLKPGIINQFTRLMLINTIYFKGQWINKFNPSTPSKFWLTTKDSIKVPMMKQKGYFSYTSDQIAQIIELPYMGKISMLIILPKQNFAKVERLLSIRLNKWLRSLHTQKVTVYLPKFKINKNFELSQSLSTMGMKNAFNNEADFSGIDRTEELYLSAVVHQAFIEVNEEGTEASAATGAIFNTRGMIPKFKADHPFIFLIRHNPSNSILFMGKVVNPS